MSISEHPPGGRGAFRPLGLQRVAGVKLERLRELSRETIEYFGEVVRDKTRTTKTRVSAGRALLAHHEFREARLDKKLEQSPEQVMRDLLGDDEALVRFMREKLPLLEARLTAKLPLLPPATEDTPNDATE